MLMEVLLPPSRGTSERRYKATAWAVGLATAAFGLLGTAVALGQTKAWKLLGCRGAPLEAHLPSALDVPHPPMERAPRIRQRARSYRDEPLPEVDDPAELIPVPSLDRIPPAMIQRWHMMPGQSAGEVTPESSDVEDEGEWQKRYAKEWKETRGLDAELVRGEATDAKPGLAEWVPCAPISTLGGFREVEATGKWARETWQPWPVAARTWEGTGTAISVEEVARHGLTASEGLEKCREHADGLGTSQWRPGVWLGDEAIDHFMRGAGARLNQGLKKLHRSKHGLRHALPRTVVLPSTVYNTFLGGALPASNLSLAFNRHGGRYLPVNLFEDVDLLLIPLHSGGHYGLGVVRMTGQREITVLDSAQWDWKEFYEVMANVLAAEHRRYYGVEIDQAHHVMGDAPGDADAAKPLPPTPTGKRPPSGTPFLIPKDRRGAPDIPKQTNDRDCGVFVCLFAEALMQGLPVQFSADDVAALRKFWGSLDTQEKIDAQQRRTLAWLNPKKAG